ncbi:hypothetical protein [Ruegeria sp. ANG-R]|uniref:hypothetical protein n=1 Tax=Ruegeria sp. ANG-R TaxID=1577903 RepID=UPI000ADBFD07|nr:hypothetical protein [Ruegeria sp. ANG-R]
MFIVISSIGSEPISSEIRGIDLDADQNFVSTLRKLPKNKGHPKQRNPAEWQGFEVR